MPITHQNDQFVVRFYDETFTNEIASSPELTTNVFTPTQELWNIILYDGLGSGATTIRWAVVGLQTDDPVTGPYMSGARVLVRPRLDIVFVIDTTGSMWDDIASVKASATEIVNAIADSGADYRIGLVDYRDYPYYPYGGYGDYPSRIRLGFSSDRDAIISAINGLTIGWGADWPESVYAGLMEAIAFPWRDGVTKAIILMGDAPPHDPEPYSGYTMSSVLDAAYAVDPAIIYPVLIGYDSQARAAFRQLADGSGGQMFEAAYASDVVDALLAAIEAILKSPIVDAGGPYTGSIGETIVFDGRDSFDPDGSIVLCEWDFESDGVFDYSSDVPLAAHIYPAEFAGLVTLRVTDDDGLIGVGTARVEVGAAANRPPMADAGGPYTGLVGETIAFDGSGSFDPDGTVVQYEWDFESDGVFDVSSTSPLAAHTYPAVFTGVVTLQVTDNGGLTATDTTPVEIRSPGACGGLYPIALHASTLAGVAVGEELDIYEGSGPGHFGWLSWTGDQGVPTLVRSLTPPGDSETYVNPNDPSDHALSVGDEVRVRPGVVNSRSVRNALDALKPLVITVPVVSDGTGQGANLGYRIVGFAQVQITDCHLPGQNRLSAIYRGHATCGD